jgi:hypothetical protein
MRKNMLNNFRGNRVLQFQHKCFSKSSTNTVLVELFYVYFEE